MTVNAVVETGADPREERLPKWAQSELGRLRMRLREAERTIRDLQGDIPDSDTFASVSGVLSEDVPLPRGARVSFRLKGDERHRDTIVAYLTRSRWDGPRLYVSGTQQIRVHPQSGNSIAVEIVD